MITIPNATFVNLNIINLTNRDRMPYKRIVALRSSNGIGIRQEIEGLTALVAQHAMIERGTLEVRLREDEEEKPKAEIRALIMTSNWEKFLRIQQDIDLLLIDAVIVAPDTAIPVPRTRRPSATTTRLRTAILSKRRKPNAPSARSFDGDDLRLAVPQNGDVSDFLSHQCLSEWRHVRDGSRPGVGLVLADDTIGLLTTVLALEGDVDPNLTWLWSDGSGTTSAVARRYVQ